MVRYTLLSALLLVLPSVAESNPLSPKEIKLTAPKVRTKSPPAKATFSSFTGKVVGDKVRMRLQPDLDGFIVQELIKNEYVSVLNTEGDYYCIAPPEPLKAYIFRSFVLDGIVEGNRVNIRLEPDLEAPVIGHFNSGDAVQGKISTINKKWLEISPPATTRFYVAKEFIEYAGGPELKEEMAKRKRAVHSILEAAELFSRSELEKDFEEIDFEKVKHGYLTVINDYADFSNKTAIAKEQLSRCQEAYLQKRIAFLEAKASLVSYNIDHHNTTQPVGSGLRSLVRMWEPVEEALYATWAEQHNERGKEDFYNEQKLVATSLTGILESFNSPVRNKPGDFIIKNKNVPIAYVYSTKIDLKDYQGKKVTLIAAPRPNNNFAFPAYYVLEIE